jgi:anti-anti-sigma regulatory factor
MTVDTSLCYHLSELVLICTESGVISYANPAAQNWSSTPLIGQAFDILFAATSTAKAHNFLNAAGQASFELPTEAWELALGCPAQYRVGNFRGYRDQANLIIIGEMEAEAIGTMQRELLELTVELTESQRAQQRQYRQLQASLDEQSRLLETIQDLTSPAVPILPGVLLLNIVGHLDSRRAHLINEALLDRVARHRAAYVIIDVSGISAIDTAIARQLIETGQAIRLLGAHPILVGINSEIAQTIVHLGVELPGFRMLNDLQQAVNFVLGQARKVK